MKDSNRSKIPNKRWFSLILQQRQLSQLKGELFPIQLWLDRLFNLVAARNDYLTQTIIQLIIIIKLDILTFAEASVLCI